MRCSQLLAIGLATAGVISLSVLSVQSPAQTAGAATSSQPRASSLGCTPTGNPDPFLPDPFKFRLAGPDFPAGLLPIDEKVKDTILNSGLPCQENVRPNSEKRRPGWKTCSAASTFIRGARFIALNSPADAKATIDHAQADTPTRWEDMDNFKQLLDVMLPANLQPPKWPTDKDGMEAERERLMPEECRALA